MAKIDEVGLAALDLIIAKTKQDPTFIQNLDIHNINAEGFINDLAVGVNNIIDCVRELTDQGPHETWVEAGVGGGGAGEAGTGSLGEADKHRVGNGITLEELLALREKLGGKK